MSNILFLVTSELNKIQSEGRAKRVAAEQELTRIEDELKQKMMEIRS